MGTGSAFQFEKTTSKCRNQEGQQRNFAKHVQGPPSPPPPHPPKPRHSPTLLSIGRINRRNLITKTQKNILDLSHSYPAIPAAPLPKAPKKLPKSYQKGTKKHPKSIQKASKIPPGPHPRKVTNKNIQKALQNSPGPHPRKVTNETPLFYFCCPWSPKWTPKGTLKSQKPT